MIAVIGLVVGVVAGLVLQPTVPPELQPYLPIAVVAALDAIFGGVRAMLDGIFDDRVFLISFLSNVIVAALIVFLGDQLGVGTQLSTAVVVFRLDPKSQEPLPLTGMGGTPASAVGGPWPLDIWTRYMTSALR